MSLHKQATMLTYLFLGTNTTLLLEFNVATLSHAQVTYKDTVWRKKFLDVIDDSLTNVR